jgi:hypothetical protein
MENAEFERRFVLDYLWFGCMVLAHQSRVLNDAHAAEINPDRRRACSFPIHTNLMSMNTTSLAGRVKARSTPSTAGTLSPNIDGHGSLPFSVVA